MASPHRLATEAATAVLGEGGNAVDAAIAAAAVLTVVYPQNVALGSDLVALVRFPDGRMICINATGGAPAAESAERLRARHGESIPVHGIDTITVPGGVGGWGLLHRLAGATPWERLFEDPVRFAEEGVPVARDLAHCLGSAPHLWDDPGAAAVFAPGGVRLELGDIMKQPALAATLRRIQADGADEFYRGRTAEQIVDGMRKLGSVISRDDLAAYEPEVRDPITARFAGVDVHTSGPNTQGFVLLRALAAFEAAGLGPTLLGSDAGVFADAFREANAVRDALLADPRFAEVELDTLLSSSAAALPVPPARELPHRPRGDTVGVAVVDSAGFAVSLIQSVYYAFGSGVLEPNTGVLLHNRGTSFSLRDDSPNAVAPRKRPAHTLMPVLVTRDGSLSWALATQGGQGQPQVHAQLLLRLLNGASPREAVSLPRFIVGGGTPVHPAETVIVEEDADPAARRALVASGDTVEVGAMSDLVGQANIVSAVGPLAAASDPRADGAVLG
ncbi:MAG TPA: gamma-glutamyltransferase [Microbacterium sp.]|uniref:gamma-glutamyltransferase family protein n=1 Tax=Microbacterium sp. TaxID=51671 RepID=UPI002BCC6968|nr:gamma-glutamyltransferase [Microbacterium sp.]HWI30044.1 gamma-glutamyltransferase [Microbacterium sp.]